jgi:ubiquinol-cytochrome c reductase cytochrome c1 subunit
MIRNIFFSLFFFFFLIFLSFKSYSVDTLSLKKQNWTFTGLFGKYEIDSLQRGLQIYQEVCSACHGMKRLRFRELSAIGFTNNQIKEYAATFEIVDGPNDEGNMYTRPGNPGDTFVSPYRNEQEARAAFNGVYPPDLSLITIARKDGPNYIYSLLTGYEDPPENLNLKDGLYYNLYTKGKIIAMSPPLYDAAIQYIDGTNPSLHQLSYDIVNFLNWVSEPELEKRKSLGLKVLLFLIILTSLLYVTMKDIWSKIDK